MGWRDYWEGDEGGGGGGGGVVTVIQGFQQVSPVCHSQGKLSGNVLLCCKTTDIWKLRSNRWFPARMIYLHYISCFRCTILVGSSRN